ncbi:hypothetical protein T190115A13A_20103 [Tenacibaculum sp. 190524A02b]|uniref:eCIS core domain-containing protein n=1 Tax=Tenacibaculum vairaonense TaxID=3137860 RepID=A0ABM9PM98_9FLAO
MKSFLFNQENKHHKKKNNNPFFKKVQAKLKTRTSKDKYEVEADKMADKVVNKTTEKGSVQKKEEEVQAKPLAAAITPLIQKKENMEEVQTKNEEETLQTKQEEEVQKMEEEEAVQAQEEEEVQSKLSSQKSSQQPINSQLKKGSGGKQMNGNTKNEMESGFGADFSNVKIHTDTNAEQMSSNIGAQAFTHGNDIYFNKGKYEPNSKKGKHLLAHELTHTIQQKGMKKKKES